MAGQPRALMAPGMAQPGRPRGAGFGLFQPVPHGRDPAGHIDPGNGLVVNPKQGRPQPP